MTALPSGAGLSVRAQASQQDMDTLTMLDYPFETMDRLRPSAPKVHVVFLLQPMWHMWHMWHMTQDSGAGRLS